MTRENNHLEHRRRRRVKKSMIERKANLRVGLELVFLSWCSWSWDLGLLVSWRLVLVHVVESSCQSIWIQCLHYIHFCRWIINEWVVTLSSCPYSFLWLRGWFVWKQRRQMTKGEQESRRRTRRTQIAFMRGSCMSLLHVLNPPLITTTEVSFGCCFYDALFSWRLSHTERVLSFPTDCLTLPVLTILVS